MIEMILFLIAFLVQPYLLYLAYMFGRNSVLNSLPEGEYPSEPGQHEVVMTPARMLAKVKESRERYPATLEPGSYNVTDDDLLMEEEMEKEDGANKGQQIVESVWDRFSGKRK